MAFDEFVARCAETVPFVSTLIIFKRVRPCAVNCNGGPAKAAVLIYNFETGRDVSTGAMASASAPQIVLVAWADVPERRISPGASADVVDDATV